MEINIDNAFINAVKLSIEPGLIKYHEITGSTVKFSHTVIFYFLRKPLFTTLLAFAFGLSILTALFIAFITLIGVLFLFLIILLIEGFLLILWLGTLSIVLIFTIFVTILLFELKYWIYK